MTLKPSVVTTALFVTPLLNINVCTNIYFPYKNTTKKVIWQTETVFQASKKPTFPWYKVSTWQAGCVHLWYPNRHQHTQSACFWLHSSAWKRVSTILQSASTSAAESRLMLLPYQRWRCLQLWGEKTKESPGEGRWEGWTVSFDWLAADGTPAVFIPRRQLISRACKSTWQVFTGAVNPADSIHFANCSDAAPLCGEDQTFVPFSPR